MSYLRHKGRWESRKSEFDDGLTPCAAADEGQRGPVERAWLVVCERRESGEEKYYLINHPADASLWTLVRAIKARWSSEHAHQQMNEDLGLDYLEGRSRRGLHQRSLKAMIVLALLQHLRFRQSRANRAPRKAAKFSGSPAPTLPAVRCALLGTSSPPLHLAARSAVRSCSLLRLE